MVLLALHQTMEQELERIFRLMALLFDGHGLHDAYVGVTLHQPDRPRQLAGVSRQRPQARAAAPAGAAARQPGERRERIDLANRMVGAPLETAEQAVGTLLGSEDGWLRSCAVHAVGGLQLHGLESELQRFENSPDPELREAALAARQRLAGDSEALPQPPPTPAEMTMGVG